MKEVQEWNRFFKDLDKYNIEHNIDRIKPAQGHNNGLIGELECSYKGEPVYLPGMKPKDEKDSTGTDA